MIDASEAVKAMGAMLRALRQSRGLRQVDLAELAGLTRLQVIHVESGRCGVAVSSYARMAAALDARFTLVPGQPRTLEQTGQLSPRTPDESRD